MTIRLNTMAAKVLASAVTLACLCGQAVSADDLLDWNKARAKLFSQVCMKAAPDFGAFARLAAKAGFQQTGDDLLYQPEVVISLQQDQGACTCMMTAGAPEPASLVVAMFERMQADFPGAWIPKSQSGSVNNTVFKRGGVDVAVRLMPAEVDGQPWILATATTPGACPK